MKCQLLGIFCRIWLARMVVICSTLTAVLRPVLPSPPAKKVVVWTTLASTVRQFALTVLATICYVVRPCHPTFVPTEPSVNPWTPKAMACAAPTSFT